MDRLELKIQRRVDALPGGLQDHVYRVKDIAMALAEHHGLDGERAALGMLAHDVARAMLDEELVRHALAMGLPVGTVERRAPVLLHGPVGAELLRREDGLADGALYRGVYWHSTCHPSLDELGKVIFLADKLDPEKQVYYPYLPLLREVAFQSLDGAVLEFLTREIVARVGRRELVHPMAVETLNAMLAASPARQVAVKS